MHPAFPHCGPALAVGTAVAALTGCVAAGPGGGTGVAPEPLVIEMTPRVLHEGETGALLIRSAGADSIVFASLDGADRWWSRGPELRTAVPSGFGEAAPQARFAERRPDGTVLDLLRKPARVTVCRRSRCLEHRHDVLVRLPERNQRSVALTAGWSSVFARRSILGGRRTVLFREVLTSGIWSLRGEWATGRWNLRAQGQTGGGAHGVSLDVSRTLFGADGMSYGLTVHGDVTRTDWLGAGPGVPGRRSWRAAAGPSVMLKGITASSLLGVHHDGIQTLQISSTRISINGDLTAIRYPVTITAEKTFAFGGGAVVSRRRDALERLTAGIRVVDDLAVNVGLSSHRLAWPEAHPSDDLRATETVVTLGGQYSVTW